MVRSSELVQTMTTVSGMLSCPYPISIILWDEHRQQYIASYSTLEGQPHDLMMRKVSPQGATHWILTERRALLVPDLNQAPFVPNPLMRARKIKAYMGQPLQYQDNLLGVIYAMSDGKRGFDARDEAIFAGSAQLVARLIETYRIADQKQEEADFDELTHVWRRRPFDLYVQERLTQIGQHSLILLDIDRFKRVNDSYGHPVGDVVLAEVARVLHQALRIQDRVCRFGGEEFAIFLEGTPLESARGIAERIRKAVEKNEISTPVGNLSVTISLGVAELQSPHDDLALATARADQALYHAKQNGRNQVGIVHFQG